MNEPVSLKSAERKAFRITFADGLWEVFLGGIFLQFAIAPLISESLGDFWSSVIFLPVWGILYIAIWLIRKYIISPRVGTFNFGKPRKKKLRFFTIILVIVNIAVFILGIVIYLIFPKISGGLIAGTLGIFILFGFSAAAYFLDYPRLFFYGLLLLVAPLVGEWLYSNHGFSHHGYPVVFGFASGLMILIGVVTFFLFLKNTPKIENPEEMKFD
jgi:hypothetical protein